MNNSKSPPSHIHSLHHRRQILVYCSLVDRAVAGSHRCLVSVVGRQTATANSTSPFHPPFPPPLHSIVVITDWYAVWRSPRGTWKTETRHHHDSQFTCTHSVSDKIRSNYPTHQADMTNLLETMPALLLHAPSHARLDNSILLHSVRYPVDATTTSTADSLHRHPT